MGEDDAAQEPVHPAAALLVAVAAAVVIVVSATSGLASTHVVYEEQRGRLA